NAPRQSCRTLRPAARSRFSEPSTRSSSNPQWRFSPRRWRTNPCSPRFSSALMPLEILDFPLVLLRRGAAGEGAEAAPLARLRISLARLEAIFAALELADHRTIRRRLRPANPRDHFPVS